MPAASYHDNRSNKVSAGQWWYSWDLQTYQDHTWYDFTFYFTNFSLKVSKPCMSFSAVLLCSACLSKKQSGLSIWDLFFFFSLFQILLSVLNIIMCVLWETTYWYTEYYITKLFLVCWQQKKKNSFPLSSSFENPGPDLQRKWCSINRCRKEMLLI